MARKHSRSDRFRDVPRGPDAVPQLRGDRVSWTAGAVELVGEWRATSLANAESGWSRRPPYFEPESFRLHFGEDGRVRIVHPHMGEAVAEFHTAWAEGVVTLPLDDDQRYWLGGDIDQVQLEFRKQPDHALVLELVRMSDEDGPEIVGFERVPSGSDESAVVARFREYLAGIEQPEDPDEDVDRFLAHHPDDDSENTARALWEALDAGAFNLRTWDGEHWLALLDRCSTPADLTDARMRLLFRYGRPAQAWVLRSLSRSTAVTEALIADLPKPVRDHQLREQLRGQRPFAEALYDAGFEQACREHALERPRIGGYFPRMDSIQALFVEDGSLVASADDVADVVSVYFGGDYQTQALPFIAEHGLGDAVLAAARRRLATPRPQGRFAGHAPLEPWLASAILVCLLTKGALTPHDRAAIVAIEGFALKRVSDADAESVLSLFPDADDELSAAIRRVVQRPGAAPSR